MKKIIIILLIKIFFVYFGFTESAMDLFKKGNDFYNKKKYNQAIEYYTKAININKKFVSAYIERAITYSTIGKNDTALLDLDKALKLDPKNVLATFNKGYIYEIIGNNNKAIEFYSKTLELNPKYLKAYLARGDLYTKLYESEKAINDYTSAIKLDPNYYYSIGERGVNYFNQEKYNLALNDFNDYFKKINWELGTNPYDRRVLYYRAFTYLYTLDLNKSLEDWNNYEKINMFDPNLYRNRGLTYLLKNEISKAIDDLNTAVKKNNTDARSCFLLLIASFKKSKSDYKKILNDLENYKNNFKNDWEKYILDYFMNKLSLNDLLSKVDNYYLKLNLYCYIGYNYLFENNKKEAKKYFEKCFKANKSGPIEFILSKHEFKNL